MSVTAIVGANWGDEGKGKITDYLSQHSDYVVRFQGGNNAGHTIINEYGKFALHLLPSGVFYKHTTSILGPGVALNMEVFLDELENLKKNNVPSPSIFISDRAQVVLPYHILFDELEEKRLSNKSFGSTKKGIAPFYSDKYLKIGIQVNEIFDETRLEERVKSALSRKNVLLQHLYKHAQLTVEEITNYCNTYKNQIKPFLKDTTLLLHNALKENKEILIEGQLGALRDPDHGIYPFPTSSSPLAGFGTVGAGVPPYEMKKIIAVTKAYSSCVGAGPFVTELSGTEAHELRERGGDAGEYGATTGRPRRVGWFDGVATKHGLTAQGANEVALTNLDVLGYLDKIKICTHYEIDNEQFNTFPVTHLLENAQAVYQEIEGWKEDISHITEYTGLPDKAKNYIQTIEDMIEVPIKWISVGPKREQMIIR
jgi:adenylosuccinate synthase